MRVRKKTNKLQFQMRINGSELSSDKVCCIFRCQDVQNNDQLSLQRNMTPIKKGHRGSVVSHNPNLLWDLFLGLFLFCCSSAGIQRWEHCISQRYGGGSNWKKADKQHVNNTKGDRFLLWWLSAIFLLIYEPLYRSHNCSHKKKKSIVTLEIHLKNVVSVQIPCWTMNLPSGWLK